MECPCSGLLSIQGIVVFLNKYIINILFLETGLLIFLGMHVEVRLLRKLVNYLYWKLPIPSSKKIPFTFPSAIHIA